VDIDRKGDRKMTNKADRILKNAKVYSVTLDDQVIRADAVGISDDKIIFVGSNQDAEAYIGEDTVVTDCAGKSVLPGFGDAHMHFAWSAKKYAVADVANIVDKKKATPDDVIEKIQGVLKDYAEEHKNYAVIQGIGWDRFWFLGALQGITRPFTRHDLDAAVPDRPVVMLSYCGHVMVLNTKAIEAAGLYPGNSDGI
jgi:predicted amidohydrolase YtcJ